MWFSFQPTKDHDTKTISCCISTAGFLELPSTHADAKTFNYLQSENYELHRLRSKLQAAVNMERPVVHKLQSKLGQYIDPISTTRPTATDQMLLAQNSFLESTARLLCEEIAMENKRIIELRIKLRETMG